MSRRYHPREDHAHPCDICGVKVFCSSPMEFNFDGYPEVICVEYHVDGNKPRCDDCNAVVAAEEEAAE